VGKGTPSGRSKKRKKKSRIKEGRGGRKQGKGGKKGGNLFMKIGRKGPKAIAGNLKRGT